MTVSHVVHELAFVLLTLSILQEALSISLPIRPLSFVEAAKQVGHFAKACQPTLIETALVDVATLERFSTFTMGYVLQPLTFVSVAIFDFHGALAVTFVLIEGPLIGVSI